MTNKMIKHARAGNFVKFGRSFREAIQAKIPTALQNERVRVANVMFNKPSDK